MKTGITTLVVVVFIMAEYAFWQTSWPDHENMISVPGGKIRLQFKPDFITDTLLARTRVPPTREDLKSYETRLAEKSRMISVFGTAVPLLFGLASDGPTATISLALSLRF